MFTATLTTDTNGNITVQAHTTLDVDRKELLGWSVGKNGALAKRLVRAIEAGKAFTVKGFATDVCGNTYLRAEANIMGRYMNADLKRLGF